MRMLALLAMPLLVLTGAADGPKSVDGLPIGALSPQSLPASGCAAYLFTTGPTRAFVAMATQSPAALTLAPGGKAVTLAQAAATGPATMTGRGFPASATFANTAISATLAMTVAERADVTRGAMVPDASLTVTPAGQDSVVVPLAGLVACRS